MYLTFISTMLFVMLFSASSIAQQQFESDVIETSSGDLIITFIGHASLKFTFNRKMIYIDPYSKLANYAQLPKADIIMITHEHRDHLDPVAIEKVRSHKTQFVLSEGASSQFVGGIVMKNGDIEEIDGLIVEAVPAYNVINKRETGEPFHPKGRGNGYVLTFGDKRVYVAGDTENIPEMKDLEDIDIAFLPMNLPFTMTPQMVAAAAMVIKPKILYPYHYGETKTSKLVSLLKKQKDIEVRIRKME